MTQGCDWREAGSECREFGHEWGPPEFYWANEGGYPMRPCLRCMASDVWSLPGEEWPIGGEVLL